MSDEDIHRLGVWEDISRETLTAEVNGTKSPPSSEKDGPLQNRGRPGETNGRQREMPVNSILRGDPGSRVIVYDASDETLVYTMFRNIRGKSREIPLRDRESVDKGIDKEIF